MQSKGGAGADVVVPRADWETYLLDTAKRILQQQSPERLMETRGRLYELLTHCIPASVVLKTLALELVRTLDTTLKVEVIRIAAEYEHRMQVGPCKFVRGHGRSPFPGSPPGNSAVAGGRSWAASPSTTSRRLSPSS